MSRTLPWLPGGILLGVVFFAALLLVKPIGVSTQFVILDAIIWDAMDPSVIAEAPENKTGYGSPNAYLNKSGGKYARNAANPLNYSFVFVGALMVGALASAFLGGDKPRPGERSMPPAWRAAHGDSIIKRYLIAFAAGFLVLFGARLRRRVHERSHDEWHDANCIVRVPMFTAAAFAVGIPTALLVFRTR